MGFSPREAGSFRLADIYDAITGYNEADSAKFRRMAELIRTSTVLLWNVHVTEESRMAPEDLWRFGWEIEGGIANSAQQGAKGLSEEEELQRQRLIERHGEWLKDK